MAFESINLLLKIPTGDSCLLLYDKEYFGCKFIQGQVRNKWVPSLSVLFDKEYELQIGKILTWKNTLIEKVIILY